MSETIILDKKIKTLELEEHDVDPVIRSMYSLPGNEFTQKDVCVYRQSADNFVREYEKIDLYDLIVMGLQSGDNRTLKTSAEMIQYVPKDKQEELRGLLPDIIIMGLQSEDDRMFKVSAEMIQYVPKDKQEELRGLLPDIIIIGLQNEDYWIRETSVEMILYAPENVRYDLIIIGLQNEDDRIRKTSAEMIQYVPEDKQEELRGLLPDIIIVGLQNEDYWIRETSVEMILYAPENVRYDLIIIGLQNEDYWIREISAEMIQYVPEDKQEELRGLLPSIISMGLQNENYWIRKASAEMIQYAPKDKQEEFRGLLPDSFKKKALLSKLYNTDVKSRKEQEKTGTTTLLFDRVMGLEKSLKNKVILRKIPFYSLMAWKKTYESYIFLQKKGFDYVPIEPIVKISKISDFGIVDVFSGVIIGPSVSYWLGFCTIFQNEILEKITKIKECLKDLGVEHGHDHDGNFVLLFYKDKNGEPDLTKCPRIYMIDFDEAFLTKTE